MEENRATILNVLSSKSALKQDIAEDTQAVFNELKVTISAELDALKGEIKDQRIRLSIQDKGEYEAVVMIGSDALFFQKHSNVFKLTPNHELNSDEIIKTDPRKSYFGVINIFNFLADSVLHNRINDSGFLIGRIFVNCEREIFVDGKGQLGFLFKNPKDNPISHDTLKHIVQCAFSYALDFDLMFPPYELIEEVSLEQIISLSAELQLRTSKRLGFKQSDDDKQY